MSKAGSFATYSLACTVSTLAGTEVCRLHGYESLPSKLRQQRVRVNTANEVVKVVIARTSDSLASVRAPPFEGFSRTKYTLTLLEMHKEKEPLIDKNVPLQEYYAAIESRIGYRLFLGGTRHFGYYKPGTKWPFPINGALRRMEDHLYDSLGLPAGSRVLDAGCGVGHVALRFARKGLRVYGIDVVENHILWAEQEIRMHKQENNVEVRLMDYHHLDDLADESFDGVYTMETFVHATDPERALAEFFRVMKPGGSIALYEYDHADLDPQEFPADLVKNMELINARAAMPSNAIFTKGTLRCMLEDQGFQDVIVKDLSENVKPMMRLFFLVAFIPYIIISFLGLQAWFVNTQAGVEGYRVLKRGLWRFVAVSARKPLNRHSTQDAARERRVAYRLHQ